MAVQTTLVVTRDVEAGERMKLAARTFAGLAMGLVKGAER